MTLIFAAASKPARMTSNSVFSSAAGAAPPAAGHGGGGNAELFLERVDELRELQNGKALDLFDHSSDLFRHCNILLI